MDGRFWRWPQRCCSDDVRAIAPVAYCLGALEVWNALALAHASDSVSTSGLARRVRNKSICAKGDAMKRAIIAILLVLDDIACAVYRYVGSIYRRSQDVSRQTR